MDNDQLEERPIPNFPGYVARADGAIVSYRRGYAKELSPSTKHPDNWPRATIQHPHGTSLTTSKTHTVASLVLSAWAGPRPSKDHIAAHRDGDPRNNRPTNLEWRTYSTLVKHRTSKALQSAQLDTLAAGLSDIIQRIRNEEPIKQIAEAHNLHLHLVETLRSTLLGLVRRRPRAAQPARKEAA